MHRRAIGDRLLKPFVTAKPEVRTWEVHTPNIGAGGGVVVNHHQPGGGGGSAAASSSTSTAGGGKDIAVVIASDGIWDVLSNNDVAQIVVASLSPSASNSSAYNAGSGSGGKTDAQRAADRLVRAAWERGSADNLTAMVVDLTRPRYGSVYGTGGATAPTTTATAVSSAGAGLPSHSPGISSPGGGGKGSADGDRIISIGSDSEGAVASSASSGATSGAVSAMAPAAAIERSASALVRSTSLSPSASVPLMTVSVTSPSGSSSDGPGASSAGQAAASGGGGYRPAAITYSGNLVGGEQSPHVKLVPMSSGGNRSASAAAGHSQQQRYHTGDDSGCGSGPGLGSPSTGAAAAPGAGSRRMRDIRAFTFEPEHPQAQQQHLQSSGGDNPSVSSSLQQSFPPTTLADQSLQQGHGLGVIPAAATSAGTSLPPIAGASELLASSLQQEGLRRRDGDGIAAIAVDGPDFDRDGDSGSCAAGSSATSGADSTLELSSAANCHHGLPLPLPLVGGALYQLGRGIQAATGTASGIKRD